MARYGPRPSRRTEYANLILTNDHTERKLVSLSTLAKRSLWQSV